MTNPVLAAFGRPFRLGIIGGAAVHDRSGPSGGRDHGPAFHPCRRGAVVPPGAIARRRNGDRSARGRCYGSVEELIAKERARDDGIEALAIITPNDSHAEYLTLALSAGLDVMMEKPLCNDLGEAKMLRELVASTGCAVAITHTFSGYPMLREMRARLLAGEIGAVRLVQVEYLAGGIATAVELGPDADKRWRMKPERVGPSLVLGDIGTHAHHLVCFVTGQPFASVSADVGTLLPGRKVHDVAQVRFRLAGGARGQMEVSNAAAGMSNHVGFGCSARPGTWHGCTASTTSLRSLPSMAKFARSPGVQPTLSFDAQSSSRLMRPGHPEGLQEAVANLYCGLADMMLARRGRPDIGRAKACADD